MQVNGNEVKPRGKKEFFRQHGDFIEKGYIQRLVPVKEMQGYYLKTSFNRFFGGMVSPCQTVERLEFVSTAPKSANSLSRYLETLWSMANVL